MAKAGKRVIVKREKRVILKRERVQPMVDGEVVKKIDELAVLFGKSRNEMAEFLLVVAVGDNEFMAKVVGRIMKGVEKITRKKFKADQDGVSSLAHVADFG